MTKLIISIKGSKFPTHTTRISNLVKNIYQLIIIISNQIPKQQNRTMINNFESDAHINLIQFFYGGLGIAPTQT